MMKMGSVCVMMLAWFRSWDTAPWLGSPHCAPRWVGDERCTAIYGLLQSQPLQPLIQSPGPGPGVLLLCLQGTASMDMYRAYRTWVALEPNGALLFHKTSLVNPYDLSTSIYFSYWEVISMYCWNLLNVFQFPFPVPWKGFEMHLYTTLHCQRTVQETMMAMVAFSNQVWRASHWAQPVSL